MEGCIVESDRQTIYGGESRVVHLWPEDHGAEEHYPKPGTPDFKSHFDRKGFVVVRNAIPEDLCRKVLDAFSPKVKQSRDYFLRHEFGTFDRHVFTKFGFMKYPIMNVQDLADKFTDFKKAALDVMTHSNIQAAVKEAFGEPGRLVHTMFFEGNQNTWPHRDFEYINSADGKDLVGALVALEDINPRAGRFYICPESQLAQVEGVDLGASVDPNSKEYKLSLKNFVGRENVECVAPILKQGDMVVFSGRAVHGSLTTSDERFSRCTLNGHWIPASHRLWQLGGGSEPSGSIEVNGVRVTCYGAQVTVPLMINNFIRTNFPRFWNFLKQARHGVRKHLGA